MAKSYKGIFVKFGADYGDLSKALREIDKKSRDVGADLNNVNKLLKLDPTNTEMIAEKQKVLAQAIETTAAKLKKLRDNEAKVRSDYGTGKVNQSQYLSYQKEIAKTADKLKSLKDQQTTFNKTVEETGTALENVGDKAVTTGNIFKANLASEAVINGLKLIATGVKNISSACIKVGEDFDTSMSQVAATMGITTDQIAQGSAEYDKLRAAAKEAGATTSYTAAQAGDALNYLALAGYDADKAVETLPKTLTLAKAGGMDLATASDMVTDAMSALKMSTSDVDMYIDQMAKTSQKSNTNVQQLGEATLACAGTVSSTAQSLTTMNTALGVLADNGLKGAEGGTKLRNILLSLSAPTSTASAELDKLGVSITDSAGNIRDVTDVMTDLNGALSNMSSSDKTKALNSIFNKTDLNAVNALLAATTGRFKELSEQIDNSSGTASAMADIMTDNIKGDLDRLKSSAENLGITMYESFGESLREGVQEGTNALDELSKSAGDGNLKDSMENLGKVVGNLITVLAKAGNVVIPTVTNALSLLLNNIGKVTIAASGLLAIKAAKGIAKIADNVSSLNTKLLGTEETLKAIKALANLGGGGVAGLLKSGSVALLGLAAGYEAVKSLYNAFRSETPEEQFQRLSEGAQDAVTNTNKLIESQQELNKQYDESNAKAEESAKKNKELAERVYDLAQYEHLTAESKDKLNTMISQLNESIPNLNLKYDETTGALNRTKEATEKLIEKQKEYDLYAAAKDSKTDLLKEQIDLESQLAESKDKLVEAEKRKQEYLDKAKEMGADKSNAGYQNWAYEYESKLQDTETEIKKLNDAIDKNSKALDDNKNKVAKVDKVVKKYADSVEKSAKETKDAAQADLESTKKQEKLSKSIETTKSEMSELASTLDKLNQKQSLSTDQVLNMISKYPQLASAVKSTKDGYVIERQALEQLIKMRAQNIKTMQAEKVATLEKQKAEADASYNAQIRQIQQAQTSKALADFGKTKNPLELSKQRQFDNITNATIAGLRKERDNNNKNIRQKLASARAQQSALNKIIDDVLNDGYKSGSTSSSSSSSNRTSSSSKSSSKKSSSSDVDKVAQRAQQLLDANEYSYKMGRKSANAYYTYMEKIDKKYYAGKKKYVEEHRELQLKLHDYRKEQQEQKTQNFEDKVAKEQSGLKTLYDNGKLSAMQYYQALDKLAKRYYKNKAKYLDKYKELENEVQQGIRKAQEDNINNITSLYEKTNDVIEAQNKLNNTNNNQTLKYSTARGLYYDKDISAVNSAKSNLYNAQKSLMQAQLSMGGTLSGAELSKILSNLPSFKNVKLPSASKVGSKNTIVNTFNFSGDIKANNPKELLAALNKFVAQNKLNKIVGK